MINSIWKTTVITLLAVFSCSVRSAAARAQAARLVEPNGSLVSLDAGNAPDGPLDTWENTGTLKGSFRNDGTNPQVKVIDSVKAVCFSGNDHMTADFKAPAGITGDRPSGHRWMSIHCTPLVWRKKFPCG
jgi:hypothetical protein